MQQQTFSATLHAVATTISVLLAVSVNGLNIAADRAEVVPLAHSYGVAERVSPQEREQQGQGMHTLGRTLQQATCTVESAHPDPYNMWYTVVDGRVLYSGAVNATKGIDFLCATNPDIPAITAYCSRDQPSWSSNPSNFVPLSHQSCPWCQIQQDMVLDSTHVRGLLNGVSTTLRLPGIACPQLVRPPAPPPAPLGPQDIVDTRMSYAYTIMADSDVNRYITISTCGLTETDTVLTVKDGCKHDGEVIARGDDYCGQQSKLAFEAKAGVMYTVFLKQYNRECFSQPNITMSASSGSYGLITGQSFLISPVLKPGLCLTGGDAGGSISQDIELQICNTSSLQQVMYLKPAGNGDVFIRNSYFGADRVIVPQYFEPTSEPNALLLDYRPGSILNTPLQERPTVNAASLFRVRPRGNSVDKYAIINSGLGECMTWAPQTEGDVTPSRVTLEPCTNSTDAASPQQEFELIRITGATPTNLMGGTYFVSLFITPTLCWEAGRASGDPLTLNYCNTTAKYQRFLVRNAGSGFVYLVEQGGDTQRVLEVSTVVQPDDTALIQMGDFAAGSYMQLWSLSHLGGGVYSVFNALTALCIDNPGSLVQPDRALQQFSCSGQRLVDGIVQNAAQSFVLTVADPRVTPPPPRAPVPPPFINTLPSPPSTSVRTPAPSPPTAPVLGVTAASGGSDGQVNTGVIIGAVVGVVTGVLLLGLLLGWFLTRRKRAARAASFHKDHPDDTPSKEGLVSTSKEVVHPAAGDVLIRQKLHIKGLVKGEPFLRGTAPHFTWSDLVPGPSCQAVEEGITALHLDRLAANTLATEDRPTGAPVVVTASSGDQQQPSPAGSGAAEVASGDDKAVTTTTGSSCLVGLYSPVVRLSSAEVTQQIELLKEGLMGRGATALVFKCRWPSRFGPNALLAAKVLKDPFQGEQSEHLQAFMYEAKVLEDLRHRNVVRIYGYCVEPPTVCLIMELLPSSLKARMTRTLHVTPQPSTLQINTGASSQARTQQITARPFTNDLIMPQKRSKESKDQMGHMTPTGRRLTNDLVDHVGVTVSHMTHVTPAGSRRTSITGTIPESHVISMMMTQPHDPHDGGFSSAELTTLSFPTNTALASTQTTAKSATTPNHPNHLSVTSNTRSDGLNSVSVVGTPIAVNSQPPQQPPVTLVVGDSSTLDASSLPSHLIQSPWASATSNAMPPSLSAVSVLGAPPRLTMLEVLQLSTDIAAGLAYLHQKPSPALDTVPSGNSTVPSTQSFSGCGDGHGMIVHRDIKPDNVLVNSDGVAKICDFGLARVHDSTTIYSVHVAVGTLRYMAPELLDGEHNKPMTDRVDLYSLGMMMWEMVAAEVPWRGLTDPQIMTAVQLKKRPSMSAPAPLPSTHAQRAHKSPSSSASSSQPPLQQPPQQQTLDNNNINDNRTSLSASILQFTPTLEDQAFTFTSQDGAPSRQISSVNTRATNSATSTTSHTASGGLAQRDGSSSSSQGGGGSSGSSQPGPATAGTAGRQGPTGPIPPDLPASFDALPQFKTLISSCWQHNHMRRPTAQGVHKLLAGLLRQAQPTKPTSTSSSGKI